MGEVWAATNLQLDVPVALKLMSAHALASADLVARFETEAKAAARLRHPNVVTVHEYGVFEGVPFIAMELLEGQDLSSRLKERGRLSHAEALPIVTGICKALRRAHEAGIVHRDLKPGNVFLVRQDDEEIVKVLDFGIAKILHGVLGAASTKAGALLGSPFYMAPEQANNEGVKIDPRTDLWALGVIAFRMLTGKLPFFGDPPISVIVSICFEPPPTASSVAPDLDARTDAFFARAFGRHPSERFQGAMEMLAAFAALGKPAQPERTEALPAAVRTPPSTPVDAPRAAPAGGYPGTIYIAAPTPVDARPAGQLATSPEQVNPRPLPQSQPQPRIDIGVSAMPLAVAMPLAGAMPLVSAVPVAGAAADAGGRPGGSLSPNMAIAIAAVIAAALAVAIVGWTVMSAEASPDSSSQAR